MDFTSFTKETPLWIAIPLGVIYIVILVLVIRQDPEHMQAHLALGKYGPRGTKVFTDEFLQSMSD